MTHAHPHEACGHAAVRDAGHLVLRHREPGRLDTDGGGAGLRYWSHRAFVPASELKPREEVTALKARTDSRRQERDDYRSIAETFARAIHALTVENDNLRKELARRSPATVTPLPQR